MDKIRISAVRYANTYPFIFGLTESGFGRKVILETDHPADCAAKLISGQADIGLIPVSVLPELKEWHIISNYCIGAFDRVRTVQLMSNSDLKDIETIYLDYRSRTSVNLAKVLAKNKWKKKFKWQGTSADFDFAGIRNNEAVVLIGDQCFEYEDHFRFNYDLALEWKEFSGLPFVFACWTANKKLPAKFIDEFNKALESGIKNIDLVVERFSSSSPVSGDNLKKYLTGNIDFNFDNEKRKAMDYFLKLMREL